MAITRRTLAAAAGFLVTVALACGDGDGPSGPRFPRIAGVWALQGFPNLVLDSCGLDEFVDLEAELANLILQTDGTLNFSQDEEEFLLLGDVDVEGMINTAGEFETEELVDVEEGVTTRLSFVGEVDGDRMTGRIVFVFVEGVTVCNVEFAFQANRVNDLPNNSVPSMENLRAAHLFWVR
jgi:hypothetical protein